MPPRVTYQLRIALRRTKPPIWRRVLVPPSMHLDTLHHPPEDCGGVWGYYEMLEALKDPNAPDHEDMSEWIGELFDPEVFSPQAVDMVLGKMRW